MAGTSHLHIIERYRPGEDDPHLKVLQAAHISDDEYFIHMVLDDLNLIIRDIRDLLFPRAGYQCGNLPH